MKLRRSSVVSVLLVAAGVGLVAAAEDAPVRPSKDGLVVPGGLSDDPAVWPNKASYRNSDDWLWRNHAAIRKMKPRVVVLNFANDVDMGRIREHAEGIARATAEATRYHGFADPKAAAFLEYDIIRYVDLRDGSGENAGKRVTSSRMPLKANRRRYEALCDYGAFFGDAFAAHYGFRDPRDPQRYLNLRELVEFGFVHEMWFYAIHDGGEWPGRETCETKQRYDEQGRPIAGEHCQAGNGRDRTMPWVGRSFRISFFNPHRGIGCAMENYGHTLEWTANSGAVPYFSKYFIEFAELDFDTRYGLPFDELYRTNPDDRESITYPTKTSMLVKVRGQTHKIEPYVATGGSVHFPPGARFHYDLSSPHVVLSTIENYRLRNGPDGKDRAEDFQRSRFEQFGAVAPDCMGAWMVYWRQCMPGLDNRCVDDEGKPMKNWWPFLFY